MNEGPTTRILSMTAKIIILMVSLTNHDIS